MFKNQLFFLFVFVCLFFWRRRSGCGCYAALGKSLETYIPHVLCFIPFRSFPGLFHTRKAIVVSAGDHV